MKKFVPKHKGPAVIKSANSNTISDHYRDSLTIAYQFIGGVVPTIGFELGGKTYPTPIMAGPIGPYDKAHESGCVGYAKAVQEAGSIFWTTFHDPEEWHKVLEAGVPAIRVIKPLADNKRLLDEIAHDTKYGAVGYAMDIDHGLTVYGELDAQKEQFASKSFDDLKLLNEASPLPFFLKGVASVHDAVMAAEIGVAGIVLSGHNNRFPCAVPPLKLLPEIRSAVGHKLKIFVDGGLNTGYDAFKAFALGADGVLSARALYGAFAQGGPDALTMKLLEMTAELKGAMANTGSSDLEHINHGCIVKL